MSEREEYNQLCECLDQKAKEILETVGLDGIQIIGTAMGEDGFSILVCGGGGEFSGAIRCGEGVVVNSGRAYSRAREADIRGWI